MTLFSCRSVPLWSQLTTRIPWVDLSPFRARNSRAQQQIAGGGHLDKLSYCSDGKNVNYNLGHTSPLDWVQCMGAIRRFFNAVMLLFSWANVPTLMSYIVTYCQYAWFWLLLYLAPNKAAPPNIPFEIFVYYLDHLENIKLKSKPCRWPLVKRGATYRRLTALTTASVFQRIFRNRQVIGSFFTGTDKGGGRKRCAATLA